MQVIDDHTVELELFEKIVIRTPVGEIVIVQDRVLPEELPRVIIDWWQAHYISRDRNYIVLEPEGGSDERNRTP